MLINETKWQYYGTPGTGGHLAVIWNSHVLPSSYVHLEVWGYHETGTRFSFLQVAFTVRGRPFGWRRGHDRMFAFPADGMGHPWKKSA